MIKVALVGNIASGKSTVEMILSGLGYDVIDTDKICHSLLVKMPEVRETFKSYDVFEDGLISRERLGKLVFSNEILRKKLENILYPRLVVEINKFFELHSNEDMCFVSIPLLFEAGMEILFDKIIFVYCDDNIRLERLISRNNYTKDYAKLRMSAQMAQEEKANKSDFVIYNNSTFEDLKTSVNCVLEQIR